MTTQMKRFLDLCAVVLGAIVLFANQSTVATETNAPQTVTGILADPNFRVVIQALEQRSGTEKLAEPEVVSTAGRQVQRMRTDYILAQYSSIATPNYTAVATDNAVVPQIHIKTRFIVVPKNVVKTSQFFSNAIAGPMTNILSDFQFRTALHALYNHESEGVETLAEPECVISSGHEAQMRAVEIMEIISGSISQFQQAPIQPKGKELGPMVDITPSILSDGYTVHMEVIALNKDLLEDEDRTNAEPIFRMRQSGLVSVNFCDNQTLVLANLKMSSVTTNNQALNESKFMPIAGNPRGAKDKTLFIFITATIVDPAGNRAHSDEELSFTQKGPPPQPR